MKLDKNFLYAIFAAVIIGGLLVYFYFQSKKGDQIKLPDNGSGIPQGWSALSVANQLHSLIDGIDWGNTNEDDIFNIITSLTNDQLAAVYNQYNTTYSTNLQAELNNEIGDSTMLAAINQRFLGII